ncbi:MAG: LicD family protein [Elusimicrobia bacterium]|nr:LicD family protein [Elusimicrobiota bacterium]MDY6039838.1 LicD family protein [Elusimicrobiaceae bacterium]
MKKCLETLFSLKRKGVYKTLTICGIKIKYKSIDKKQYLIDIHNAINTINDINYKQNLIMDYFIDAKMAKPATGALRQRQLLNVELLKEFVRICNKFNLDYWLDYGSLLGAKRHGGYVPWDDDLDIAMEQESLDKFKQIVNSEINPKYKFANIITCYNRMTFTEDNGSFLDIYEYKNTNNRYRINEPHAFFSADKLSTPKEIIYPLSTIKFEDIEVKCPHDTDTYLRIKYGNYNLLPKKVHNVPGHISIEEHIIYYKEENI